MSLRFKLLHVVLPVLCGPVALIGWQEDAKGIAVVLGLTAAALIVTGATKIGPRTEGGQP